MDPPTSEKEIPSDTHTLQEVPSDTHTLQDVPSDTHPLKLPSSLNQEEAEDGTGGVEEARSSLSTSELDTQNANEHSVSIETSLTRDSQTLSPMPPATEAQMHVLTDKDAVQISESQDSEQLESDEIDVDRKVANPMQSPNYQDSRTDLKSQNILDPHPSEAPPTDLSQSEALPTDLPQSEAPPTDLPQSEALPTDLLQSEAPPTDLPQSEGPPTDLPQSVIPHTDLPQSEAPPTDLQQSEALPTDLQPPESQSTDLPQSEGLPTDLQQSEAPPTDLLSSGRPDKSGNQGDPQMEQVGDHTASNNDDIKDSADVSPHQKARHTSSPMNSLSLEGETGEVKAARKEELKSTLLKSAGIQLQQGSQHSTQEYTTPRQQNSNVSASDQPPTLQGKPVSIPMTKYDSPSLDDRNLEQFSEILLDSDLSPSDSEFQIESPGPRQKAEKRVRFADEVEALWKGGATASDVPPAAATHRTRSPPPLTGLTSGGGEEVTKHPGIPVSSSPTSPRTHDHVLPSPTHTLEELISGVEYAAEYLGSTPIFLAGTGARTHQAQQAVKLIKDPENETSPRFSVKVKISTKSIRIADSQSNVDLMDHPLHTVTYVADIDNVLVIMAHRATHPSSPTINSKEEGGGHTPKLNCHILEAPNARLVALAIGQAFSAAYREFLKANGITEEDLEDAEYNHILNAQSRPQVEVESLTDRDKTRKLTLAKHKGEMMGIMLMESGYGSAIPSCVIAHMSKTGAAARSGLLNVGDHIISVNGVSLVGMPQKACIDQIKRCRSQNVVKMVVCSCPAVVDLNIVRPDLKFQLGFTVKDGVVYSLERGSIAERSGIRVGHRIIEINGTSTVGLGHDEIVYLLSTTVGDLHIRTMSLLMYKLLTGQAVPEYH